MRLSDESLQGDKSDKEFTEPVNENLFKRFKRYLYLFGVCRVRITSFKPGAAKNLGKIDDISNMLDKVSKVDKVDKCCLADK